MRALASCSIGFALLAAAAAVSPGSAAPRTRRPVTARRGKVVPAPLKGLHPNLRPCPPSRNPTTGSADTSILELPLGFDSATGTARLTVLCRYVTTLDRRHRTYSLDIERIIERNDGQVELVKYFGGFGFGSIIACGGRSDSFLLYCEARKILPGELRMEQDRLPAGRFRIRPRCDQLESDFEMPWREIELAEGEQREEIFDLRPKRHLRATVAFAGRYPSPSVYVRLHIEGKPDAVTSVWEAQDQVIRMPLETGGNALLGVELYAPGYEVLRFAASGLPDGPELDLGLCTFHHDWKAIGRVVDERGSPVEGVEIETRYQATRTDGEGAFWIGFISADGTEARFFAEGYEDLWMRLVPGDHGTVVMVRSKSASENR